MKEYFKPVNIVFYLLAAIVFLFLGMLFASLMGAGKNQGLAAGAIVLGYGVMTAFIAFLAAVVTVRFAKSSLVILLTKLLSILLFLLLAFFFYRYQSKAEDKPDSEPKRKVTKPVSFITVAADNPLQNHIEMGLGMCSPRYFENDVFYFYSTPNLQKSIQEHSPVDSLVFLNSESGLEIKYAPPWFVPVHLKLDYGFLFLRVVSLNREYLEVVVNETNGQTFFVDRFKNTFHYWPDFLLKINSIEAQNRDDNPVRIKPLRHASMVSTDYAFLKPLRVSDQWIQVQLLDEKFKDLGKGWIRWRENGRLIIDYSLLS